MKKGTIALFGFAGITLLAGLLLSGCAHTQSVQGNKTDEGTIQNIEDEDAIQQIGKGKTTRNEILKWFGAPDRIIEDGVSLGKNQEVYIYETSEVRRKLHFGPFGARSSERKKTLMMIWIDKDTGVVEDYKKGS